MHPHALKSALEDSGMLACGMCPISHPLGGAAAEGGQSYHGRLVVTGQQRFQHVPFHGHPVWILRYGSQVPQPHQLPADGSALRGSVAAGMTVAGRPG